MPATGCPRPECRGKGVSGYAGTCHDAPICKQNAGHGHLRMPHLALVQHAECQQFPNDALPCPQNGSCWSLKRPYGNTRRPVRQRQTAVIFSPKRGCKHNSATTRSHSYGRATLAQRPQAPVRSAWQHYGNDATQGKKSEDIKRKTTARLQTNENFATFVANS